MCLSPRLVACYCVLLERVLLRLVNLVPLPLHICVCACPQILDEGLVKVVKSGTDFRFLTEVKLDFSKPQSDSARSLPFTVSTVTHEITSGLRLLSHCGRVNSQRPPHFPLF